MPEALAVRDRQRGALAESIARDICARSSDEEIFSIVIVLTRYLAHRKALQHPNAKMSAFRKDPREKRANHEFMENVLQRIQKEQRDPVEVPIFLILVGQKLTHYACTKFAAELREKENAQPEVILKAKSPTTLIPLTSEMLEFPR